MSISGGLEQAILAAAEIGFDAVQLFSKNSNQWSAKPITPELAELFHTTLETTQIRFPLIHDSYLINLGTAKPDLYQKSCHAFLDELARAHTLGVPNVVMHPGTPTDDRSADPVEAGLARIADAIDFCFKSLDDLLTKENKAGANQTAQPQTENRPNSVNPVHVLLETTAGQGDNLGWSFEHLTRIIERSQFADRLGVCIDTCHIHAAGYSILNQHDYETTFAEFDRIVGLDRLKAFHLNDSVKGLGSRVDRHAHFGHGTLGLEPFRLLVNDVRFQEIPMYLETPKGTTLIEGGPVDWDVVNLQTLRNLVQ